MPFFQFQPIRQSFVVMIVVISSQRGSGEKEILASKNKGGNHEEKH
jgi:hypothetical protein